MKIVFVLCAFAAVSAGDINPLNDRTEGAGLEQALLLEGLSQYHEFAKRLPRAVEEDANLKVVDLVKKYQYPIEDYYITTKDGYILNVHRIPHGREGPTGPRPVVFLMHGILSSSADWIIPGPEKGFAYILADKGYDVWMGNARGNRYSRNHTIFDPDGGKYRKAFWDFSWHEIGFTDVPAMIDFALETTQQKSLFHIGHSQGTTTFYVMTSEKPEYNDKIKAHFSLAPIAFMNHMTSPLFRMIALAEGGLGFLLNMIGMYEFLPNDGFLHNAAKGLCDDGILQPLCTNSLFVMCGFNAKQLNTTLLPILMGHTPAGSATKQFLHYAQEINSGKFRQYDFGLFKNMKVYGSISPPTYKLNKVKAPVYLLYSHNDWLAAKTDVLKLYGKLGNVKGKFLISDSSFNHLDYMFGIDADTLVYNKVLSLMTHY